MCSASQPSSRASTDAMRNANAFLASRALPPYWDPNDQISRVSGKWVMYLVSLHGHGTSVSPSSSGAPMLWTAGTHSVLSVIRFSAADPIRVIRFMLTTT